MRDYTDIKMDILNKLVQVEYTDTYAFAIRDRKMLCAVIIENASDILPMVTYCDKVAKSKGNDYSVRMLNKIECFELLKDYARDIVPIMSVNNFEREYSEKKRNGYKGNRGDFFEYLFTVYVGGKQNIKRNAKCTECGDVIINGEHIQVKFYNATIITESQVNRFYIEHLERDAEHSNECSDVYMNECSYEHMNKCSYEAVEG